MLPYFLTTINESLQLRQFQREFLVHICIPFHPSIFLTYPSCPECTWPGNLTCVSLFVDMFDSMPEQSPSAESKAATTPSVDLFGSGTGAHVHHLSVPHVLALTLLFALGLYLLHSFSYSFLL
jgi:hypothetical protein